MYCTKICNAHCPTLIQYQCILRTCVSFHFYGMILLLLLLYILIDGLHNLNDRIFLINSFHESLYEFFSGNCGMIMFWTSLKQLLLNFYIKTFKSYFFEVTISWIEIKDLVSKGSKEKNEIKKIKIKIKCPRIVRWKETVVNRLSSWTVPWIYVDKLLIFLFVNRTFAINFFNVWIIFVV